MTTQRRVTAELMVAAKEAKWILGARSETGYVREANEDRMGFIRAPFGNIYIVSDGMGGYRGGALAAELTVSTLQDKLATLSSVSTSFAEQVREAFAATNKAVFERRRADDPDTRNMGATGVLLVTAGARALVGHVGDSRAYLFRHKGRTLRQLTCDHTRVQSMVDAGVLTKAQAADHPDASTLDRAIGHQPTVESDVSTWIEVHPGDMILLCSDGLSGYVDDAEICRVMRSKGRPQDLADKLVDLALSKGGGDNVTVQLVRLGDTSSALWRKRLSEPMFVAAAAMFASLAVVWGVASQHLETADARIGVLEKQLQVSNQRLAFLRNHGSNFSAPKTSSLPSAMLADCAATVLDPNPTSAAVAATLASTPDVPVTMSTAASAARPNND